MPVELFTDGTIPYTDMCLFHKEVPALTPWYTIDGCAVVDELNKILEGWGRDISISLTCNPEKCPFYRKATVDEVEALDWIKQHQLAREAVIQFFKKVIEGAGDDRANMLNLRSDGEVQKQRGSD